MLGKNFQRKTGRQMDIIYSPLDVASIKTENSLIFKLRMTTSNGLGSTKYRVSSIKTWYDRLSGNAVSSVVNDNSA